MSKLSIFGLVILGIVLLVLLASVVFSLCIIFSFFKKQKKGHVLEDWKKPDVDWFLAQDIKDCTITSFDGLKLYARFLSAYDDVNKAKATVLLMHGFHATGVSDYSAALKFYHQNGFNILLPDERAHEKSEGKSITFGVKERYDCKDWINYINSNITNKLPIVLHGLSMGCATVLMTLGFELPENVKCTIADCGFTTPDAIMKKVLKQWFHLPAFPIITVASPLSKIFAGFSFKEYSTLTALKTNKIPVFFMHGEADTFVPVEMTKENYAICVADKQLELCKTAEHGLCFTTEPERYSKQILEFITRHIK